MASNQIIIDLGKIYGEGSVANSIAEHAARQLLKAESEVANEFHSRVKRITDEEIGKTIQPMICEAISAAVQLTDSFGQSKGEPTTLREIIVKRVEEELRSAQRADYIDTRHRNLPLLQVMIEREVARAVKEDLTEAMNNARKQVKEAVEAQGAAILTETIQRMARS